jgi:hypothetical protein
VRGPAERRLNSSTVPASSLFLTYTSFSHDRSPHTCDTASNLVLGSHPVAAGVPQMPWLLQRSYRCHGCYSGRHLAYLLRVAFKWLFWLVINSISVDTVVGFSMFCDLHQVLHVTGVAKATPHFPQFRFHGRTVVSPEQERLSPP